MTAQHVPKFMLGEHGFVDDVTKINIFIDDSMMKKCAREKKSEVLYSEEKVSSKF